MILSILVGITGLFPNSDNRLVIPTVYEKPVATLQTPVTLPYVHVERVANHQEIERDPNFPFGYAYSFTLPPLASEPTSITFKFETSNVAYWKWENLHPTVPMNNSGIGAPIASISAHHQLITRKPDQSVRQLLYGRYTQISYSQYGNCSSPGLLPFDGTIDGDGPSGWSYSCPGDCVSNSNSGDYEITIGWNFFQYWEKQMWLEGKTLGYTPWVDFYSPFINCPSNVAWETNHWWWNFSDMRSTVDLTITIQ